MLFSDFPSFVSRQSASIDFKISIRKSADLCELITTMADFGLSFQFGRLV